MLLTTHVRRLTILHLLLVSAPLLVSSCAPGDRTTEQPLFSLVPVERSGIDFVNEIVEQEGFNVLEYEYFYNGGGVAVGDINNDGLPDLYFTANMGPDRLYLNKGNLQFEDITEAAGIFHTPSWTTGVTMVDINGDGLLDIYVCRSGNVSEDRRRNVLYINNGDLTFTERAAEFGIDDPSYSNLAVFFDYDRDGDLDMFLLNHSIERYFRFNVYFMKQQRDPLAGDKLYRNDNGFFVDVSEEAGIIGNPLGFGLSAIVSDINKDGWLDLYVANDYVEDDYLYINNRDGTFREEIRSWFAHTSYSSMGSDIADFNNDGLPDIVTLDMLAEDNLRQKLLKGPEDFRFYQNMRINGYHEQYMRNMLQLNNGNGSFSEIGQLAGVATTDWSWAALFADFDRDGYKDILVTNGYMRDYTNMDFLEFTLKEAFMQAQQTGQSLSAHELVQHMPTSELRNYVFRNNGHLQFEDKSVAWGLNHSGLSNGAVYVDLDRDGDLDIVVNNINSVAYVYENLADQRLDTRYLQIRLEGPPGNLLRAGIQGGTSRSERRAILSGVGDGEGIPLIRRTGTLLRRRETRNRRPHRRLDRPICPAPARRPHQPAPRPAPPECVQGCAGTSRSGGAKPFLPGSGRPGPYVCPPGRRHRRFRATAAAAARPLPIRSGTRARRCERRWL
jgi:enediyne biosynthesis protein E4